MPGSNEKGINLAYFTRMLFSDSSMVMFMVCGGSENAI